MVPEPPPETADTAIRAGRATVDCPAGPRRTLFFLVTEDWYFWSHRLPQARAAMTAGFDVTVICRVSQHRQRIEAAGIRVLPLAFHRHGLNPLREIATVLAILRLYRREQPSIVHHVAMKPVIYGSLSARLTGIATVVNALAGLGYVFSSTSLKARLIRPWLRRALGMALAGPRHRVVVQNDDDRDFLITQGLASESTVVLIGGSGVDTAHFQPSREAPPPVIFALVGRMLRDKGVEEFAEAARRLRAEDDGTRFWLVGDVDPGNPASLDPATLHSWQADGRLVWRSHVADIAEIWRDAHVAVLPSYREGLPKTLLEAAAAGRPMVASDVPGCREIARHEETALSVPARDATALATAMARLASDPALRQRLGGAARDLVMKRFSESHVEAATAELYRSLAP